MRNALFGWLVAVFLAADALGAAAPRKGRVMFWYDTEDYVTPESMDAAKFHADLLTEFGYRGNFAVVGFYAQRLLECGRTDVIAALKRHCIGSQTLFHSRHPTICEYTDVQDWSAAYRRCLAEESDCLGRLKAIFGLDEIAFFVPPGISVTPVATSVYADLGVPIYGGGIDIYGHRLFERLAWYDNMLQVPYNYTFGTQTDGVSNDMLASRELTVIATHPCNIATRGFWDGVNYRGRDNHPWRQWQKPPLLTAEEQTSARQAWRDLMTRIKKDSRLTVLSCDDILRAIKPRVAITRADVPALLRVMEAGLEPVEQPASWCVSDVFQAAVSFLRGAATFMPSKAWGFIERPVGITAPVTLRRSDLVAAAEKIDTKGFVPPQIAVGDKKVGPGDFLIAALKALATDADAVTVAPCDPYGLMDKHLRNLREFRFDQKSWCIYAPSLRDEYLSDRLRGQVWTLRYED